MRAKRGFLLVWIFCLSIQAFDFARDGMPLCAIAVPREMTDLEIIAKDDLASFLGRITGAEFRIVPEDQVDGPAVYVGFTDYARRQGVDFSALGDEEWIIRTSGRDLILTGGGKIGPFYAVTSLLRKLGCYTLSMDQEVYPRQATLSLADPDERRHPAFAGRSIFDVFSAKAYYDKITYEAARAYNMYILRNFRNGCGQSHKNFLPYYTGKSYDFSQNPEFHSLMLFIPPEKYFASHPEYYSMDSEGRRVRPRGLTTGGCLCMSNPEVAEVVSRNMLEMIGRERRSVPRQFCTSMYDFSLLDNFHYICKCPACQRIIEGAGGEDGGGNTYLMLSLANRIARRIAAEYPGITLRIFSYSCCRQPPAVPIRIERNILVQYCDLFASGDAYRPLTSRFNEKALSQIEGWHRTGARLMVWDYWNLPSRRPRPETVIDTLQQDFRLFRDKGVESLFLEAELQQYCPQSFMMLQYFVGAQLMENPDQDVERLIDVFLKGYYGPAAGSMKEYLDSLRQGVKAHPNTQVTIRIEQWCYLDTAFLLGWHRKLETIEKTLAEGSPYRFRVQMERLTLLWNICLSANSYQAAFAKAGYSMKDLKRECCELSRAFFYRHGYEATKRRDAELQEQLDLISLEMPVPDLFRNVPEDHLQIFGQPDYHSVASLGARIVEDPDAIQGKAVKSACPDERMHGAGKKYRSGGRTYCATEFFLSNIDCQEPDRNVSLLLAQVPQDEKYHWYRFPRTFNMNAIPWFWGHGWGIQVDIARAYVISDGVSDANLWDGWFRVKFTGPAYVPGSKQENAIWYDYLILVRPGEKSLSGYPRGGLVQ